MWSGADPLIAAGRAGAASKSHLIRNLRTCYAQQGENPASFPLCDKTDQSSCKELYNGAHWPFGIAMGQVGHAWLGHTYGWQVPFQAASVYCPIAALRVYLLYRPPHDLPHAGGGRRGGMTTQEWHRILCAAAAWSVFNAAYVTYLAFGPKVLEDHGQSAIAAAGLIGMGSWTMIFSGAACGQIVDRFAGRTIALMFRVCGAIGALLLLRLPDAGFGASMFFGLIGMAPTGVIMAMAGQAMRPQVGAFGMGTLFSIYCVTMLVTPPVAGAILDSTDKAQGPI
ncbi:MFS transporter [uncultured Roseobacter sp.]|uniref:MFS transporter n=1 Tax=uncultured Roseobacter sp. TaxID=114847 RepID=UPI00262E5CD6|nr:MFS transporter [uncultured Roseobacter sp.]